MTFMPNDEILEEIGWNKKSASKHAVFQTDTPRLKEYLPNYVDKAVDDIAAFYRNSHNIVNMNVGKMEDVVWEALKNCWLHGPNHNSPFTYGVFMGSKAICHGFKDMGDYFKRPEIKEQFENKIEITEFEKRPLCYGRGINEFIFPRSDKIFVDEKEGILYCIQYLDNLKFLGPN